MPSRFRWSRLLLLLLIVIGLAAGGWYAAARGKSVFGGEAARHTETKPAAAVSVEVMTPRPGGIRRMSVQPGTVEPFQAADLYAKVSGFLVEQRVDIGSRVNKGDVLARIAVPEYEKQVQRDTARAKNAAAKVKQMEAHLKAAQAEAKAADAAVVLARVMVRAKVYFRQYREKQLERIRALALKEAVDAKLVDEQEDYYLSALEGENAAKEQVNASQEKAVAARAVIEQVEADVEEAKAGVEVAAAEVQKSQVLLDYTVIRSPYTGVVTKRSFHPGDFIKSADQGGSVPILAVERTDRMRMVVRIPDRDVPYVSLGDPAVVEIDALPGVVFQTTGGNVVGVSRWAESEDPQTRTMRTEVDVPNPDAILRTGMYGRVTLTLSDGTPNAVRIPSAALLSQSEGGRGSVRVVRGDKVAVVPVRFATDDGLEVEIVAGLSPTDRVIVRATGPAEEGATVSIEGESSGH